MDSGMTPVLAMSGGDTKSTKRSACGNVNLKKAHYSSQMDSQLPVLAFKGRSLSLPEYPKLSTALSMASGERTVSPLQTPGGASERTLSRIVNLLPILARTVGL